MVAKNDDRPRTPRRRDVAAMTHRALRKEKRCAYPLALLVGSEE